MHCRNCGAECSDQAIMCVKCGTPPLAGNKYCPNCGSETDPNAVVCVKCGVSLAKKATSTEEGEKSWLVALFLCLFLGWVGAHDFYTGNNGRGIAKIGIGIGGFVLLITVFLSFLSFPLWAAGGVWILVDLICIIIGKYKDGQGRPLKQ